MGFQIARHPCQHLSDKDVTFPSTPEGARVPCTTVWKAFGKSSEMHAFLPHASQVSWKRGENATINANLDYKDFVPLASKFSVTLWTCSLTLKKIHTCIYIWGCVIVLILSVLASQWTKREESGANGTKAFRFVNWNAHFFKPRLVLWPSPTLMVKIKGFVNIIIMYLARFFQYWRKLPWSSAAACKQCRADYSCSDLSSRAHHN